MKYIDYAGVVRVMTGDETADAVIRYAAALHQSRLSDVVSVPTVDECGAATRIELLLVPAVAIALEPAPDDELEPVDGAFRTEIARRTEAVLALDPHPNRADFGR